MSQTRFLKRFLLALLLSALGMSSSAQPSGGILETTKLPVMEYQDKPVREIIKELAEPLGFEVVFHPLIDGQASLSATNISVDGAIKEVLATKPNYARFIASGNRLYIWTVDRFYTDSEH